MKCDRCKANIPDGRPHFRVHETYVEILCDSCNEQDCKQETQQ